LALKGLIIHQTRITPILIRRVLLLHGLDEAIRINVCREHEVLSAGAVTERACSGHGKGSGPTTWEERSKERGEVLMGMV
jgi:hypothetical protein